MGVALCERACDVCSLAGDMSGLAGRAGLQAIPLLAPDTRGDGRRAKFFTHAFETLQQIHRKIHRIPGAVLTTTVAPELRDLKMRRIAFHPVEVHDEFICVRTVLPIMVTLLTKYFFWTFKMFAAQYSPRPMYLKYSILSSLLSIFITSEAIFLKPLQELLRLLRCRRPVMVLPASMLKLFDLF